MEQLIVQVKHELHQVHDAIQHAVIDQLTSGEIVTLKKARKQLTEELEVLSII